jgi:RNA polymerase sigma-70 factor (ECF subfamily)
MQRYADGDPRAFSALHRELAPRLRAVLVRMLGAGAPCDDILQGVLMRAHLARHRFEPAHADADAAVLAWYSAIARNAARDWVRTTVRESTRTAGDTDIERLVSPGQDAETRMLGEETESRAARQLEDALAQLPETQRELIELHKLRDMPFREIAKRLGVREGAARVRAHRAYKALWRRLVTSSRGTDE